MKRLFVSQPMRGKTDEEILAVRESAIVNVKEILADENDDSDIEVIDSFFQSAPVDANPLWFLGKSIELLSTADIVYFADGWTTARGCVIEHMCAEKYGLEMIEDVTDC